MLESEVTSGSASRVGEARDGPADPESKKAQRVDLLFRDIRLPEIDGFEVLERIPPEDQTVVDLSEVPLCAGIIY